MRILMSGATGFIGNHLVSYFQNEGHTLYILTRQPKEDQENIHYIGWLTDDNVIPDLGTTRIDVCINLAGASINGSRWTDEYKEKILTSRLAATSALLEIVKQLEQRPTTWINASAINIYPSSKRTIYLDTVKNPHKDDFLANTVARWEAKAKEAEALGIRVVFTRFGLVLGNDGGAFPVFQKLFASFLGGRFAHGKNWYSFIHIDDLVRGYTHIIDHPEIAGVVNLTAPHPVTQKKFANILGHALHRPSKVNIPKFALRIGAGERATVLLESQRAQPQKLLESQFHFQYPTIEEAVDALVNDN